MIPLDRLDQLVVDLWGRRAGSRESAMQLMRTLFREEGLRPKQQKRVKSLFHQWLSSEAMVEHAVEVAAPGEIMDAIAAPIHLLASRVLSGDLSPKAAMAKVGWIDWERVAQLPAELRTIDDPIRRLELIGSITPWLARRMHEVLGDEAQLCLESLLGKAPVTIRTNTLLCTREQLRERLDEEGIETAPTRIAAQGLEVVKPAQLLRSKAYRDGWFELQDEASQLVAEIVAPPLQGLVVDACAGAGGKTLALAAMLGRDGSVLALDNDAPRLDELRRRARRAGARNIRIARVPPNSWPAEIEDVVRRADRILVDAPCTGLGSLRRNPDLRDRITNEEVRNLNAIQLSLLSRAASMLAPGARLVYATCTILPEENEAIVAKVLARHPDLVRIPVAQMLGDDRGALVTDEDGLALQTMPHRNGMDGFYCAVVEHAKQGMP